MEDSKRDYIIKALSRTKRKDYENYVVNGIWHRLDDINIKITSQQYFRRIDGKYALIDLYFPQLNYGVECDEVFHKANEDKDLRRTMSMEEMLSSLQENSELIIRRIDVDRTIEEINNQIIEIVYEIRELYQMMKVDLNNSDKTIVDEVINKGSISRNDNARFRTILDITRLFGKNYKGYQHAFFRVNEDFYVWCPKISKSENGIMKSITGAGWINYMSDDWDKIYESNSNKGKLKHLKQEQSYARIVFAYTLDAFGKRAYRYMGVYKKSEESKDNLIVYDKLEVSVLLNNIIFM